MSKDKKEIDKARIEELTKKYVEPKIKNSKYEGSGNLYNSFVIGANLFTHVIVGLAIGYGLDHVLHTKPLFIIIFIFLGFAAGIRQIYKRFSK